MQPRVEGKSRSEVTGIVLRDYVREWLDNTSKSSRTLSKDIGCEANYLTSWMGRSPRSWTVPKYPTMGLLLEQVGLTPEALERMVDKACLDHEG